MSVRVDRGREAREASDMPADLGHAVAGMTIRLKQAMDMAGTTAARIAILKINLDGRRCLHVGEVSREGGVKLICASGDGSPGFEANELQIALSHAAG